MALIKNITTPNGVTTTYHRVENLEGKFPDLVICVRSYISSEKFLEGKAAQWTWYIPLDATNLLVGFEAVIQNNEAFIGAISILDTGNQLDSLKARKVMSFKAIRDQYDYAPISYADFFIDSTERSVIDIMGSVMKMQAKNLTTIDWRCSDNVWRTLTIQDLIEIGSSMADRRAALIRINGELVDDIEAATTEQEVNAINFPEFIWPIP
jgi:hypothetical protein